MRFNIIICSLICVCLLSSCRSRQTNQSIDDIHADTIKHDPATTPTKPAPRAQTTPAPAPVASVSQSPSAASGTSTATPASASPPVAAPPATTPSPKPVAVVSRPDLRYPEPYTFLGEPEFVDFTSTNAAEQLRREYSCPYTDETSRRKWRTFVDDCLSINMDDWKQRDKIINRVQFEDDFRHVFLYAVRDQYQQWRRSHEELQKQFPNTVIND